MQAALSPRSRSENPCQPRLIQKLVLFASATTWPRRLELPSRIEVLLVETPTYLSGRQYPDLLKPRRPDDMAGVVLCPSLFTRTPAPNLESDGRYSQSTTTLPSSAACLPQVSEAETQGMCPPVSMYLKPRPNATLFSVR